MTAPERMAHQVQRNLGAYPAAIWDVRLDPYWRAVLARVAKLPPAIAETEWPQIETEKQERLTRAMFDAFRLGRAMMRGFVQ